MGKKKVARSTTNDNAEPEAKLEGRLNSTFEDSLNEVEQVVEQLESGDLSLDDSLRQYERGVLALRICFEHLRNAERKIELLVGFDGQGQPLTKPFSDEAATLEEKQSARGERRGIRRPLSESGFSDNDFNASNLEDNDLEDGDFDEDGSSYVDESPGLF